VGLYGILAAVPPGLSAGNQPLVITTARLLLPTRRLRFVRAAGVEPVLAYGAEGLGPPRYDIALLAPRILGASAHEIDPLPEVAAAAEGPDESDEGYPSERNHRLVFWSVLGASIVALLAVLARLLRVEGAGA